MFRTGERDGNAPGERRRSPGGVGRGDSGGARRLRVLVEVLLEVVDDPVELPLIRLLHLAPDLRALLTIVGVLLERGERCSPFEITDAVSMRLYVVLLG